MKTTRSHIALALVCAAAVAGCGSDDEPKGKPIPAAIVSSLDKELDAVERRFDVGGGACGDIETKSTRDIERLVRQIPNDVDREVRDALQQSIDRLFELARDQCNDTEPEPETTPDTVETQPEPPPTVPSVPTTPPQTETQEQPDKPNKPNNGNGNNGNGNGGGNNGNGNGGTLTPEPPADGGSQAPEGVE